MIAPTPETIRAALSFLSPDLPREDWVKVGMAVKDGLNGDGFTLFDEWSKGGQTYNATDARDAWKSFKADGRVTVGTLFFLAQQAGWQPGDEAHQETEAERMERERQRRQRQERETRERERRERAAAKKQRAVWKVATALQPDHGYFARKLPGMAPPRTLKEIPAERAAEILGYAPKSDGEPLAGRLIVVPVKVGDIFTTAELIDEAGRKSAIYGGAKSGGYWTPAPLPDGDGAGLVLAIGEGMATVLSAHQGTGFPAIAALSAGNLPKVAATMRQRHPAARLLILGDVGGGLKFAEQAAEATGAALAVPEFTGLDATEEHADFNDLAALAGLDTVKRQILGALDRHQPPAPSQANGGATLYTLRAVEDFAAQPPQRYRIKPIFPETGIAAIFGPSGSGKSFLGFDMAGAIAGRADWFGYRVRSGAVAYLCLEGGGGLRNRIAAYRTHHGGGSLENIRFGVEPFDLLTGDPAALVRAVKGAGMEAPTLFIDTLNRAAPTADENSSVDMGRIIEACKRIQAATGGLVVLIHHTGKDAHRGLRGHSSLFAALDAAIQVSRDGDRREWSLAKSKDGTDGKAHGFGLRVLDLGTDEDGDPVTSCVVEAESIPYHQDRKPKAPTGGNQKIVWDFLKEMLRDRRAIPTSEVIDGVRGRLVCDEKRKPERIRQALTAMINAGLLTCLDDTLSFPVSHPVPVPPKGGNGKTGKWDSRNFPETGDSGNGNDTGQGRRWDFQNGRWANDDTEEGRAAA